MSKHVFCCFGLLLASFQITSLRADIAPKPIHGGVTVSPFGGESKEIAMADEVVKVHVTDKKCSVNVVFKMKNLTDKPVTMEIGFPGHYEEDMVDFTVLDDGKKVTKIEQKGKRPYREPEDPPGLERFWKIWKHTFPANEISTIEVSYWNNHNHRHHNWERLLSNEVEAELLKLSNAEEKKRIEQDLMQFSFGYILRSGAGWAGDIGRCRIEMKFEGIATDAILPSLLEDNYPLDNHKEKSSAKITKDSIIWDVSDLGPWRDIRLTVAPRLTKKQTYELVEAYRQRFPANVLLTSAIYDIRMQDKNFMEAEALLEKLFKHWESKAAMWGPESRDPNTQLQTQHLITFMRVVNLFSLRNDDEVKKSGLNRSKILACMRPIVLRLCEQMRKAPKTDTFVKHYKEDLEDLLKSTEPPAAVKNE